MAEKAVDEGPRSEILFGVCPADQWSCGPWALHPMLRTVNSTKSKRCANAASPQPEETSPSARTRCKVRAPLLAALAQPLRWPLSSSLAPGGRVAGHQSQTWTGDGTGQAVDALECPWLWWAPAKEPAERVPEAVLGHEPVRVVL